MNFKQLGFTLMETMIALGISGVAGYIFLEQTELTGKAKVKAEVHEVITSVAKVIQKKLAHRATCSLSLAGLGPGDEVPALIDAELNPLNPSDPPLPSTNGQTIVKNTPLVVDVMSSPRIDLMKIINDGGINFLEVTFNPDPLDRKKLIGAQTIKKRFQIQGNVDASLKYLDCNSESGNLLESAATESCASLGGTHDAVTEKCTLDVSSLVDTTPVSCPSGSKFFPKVVSGKLSMGCQACPPIRVWSHYECNKPFSGMNWVNMCYYKSVCQWDTSILFSSPAWDGKVGPTNANGGDTGTQSNCHDRRRKCSGEP